jgi:hypothetical protein
MSNESGELPSLAISPIPIDGSVQGVDSISKEIVSPDIQGLVINVPEIPDSLLHYFKLAHSAIEGHLDFKATLRKHYPKRCDRQDPNGSCV